MMVSIRRFAWFLVGVFICVCGMLQFYLAAIGQFVAATPEELSRNTGLGIGGLVVIMGGYLIVRNCIEDDLRDDDE